MTVTDAKIQVCQSITDHVKSIECLNNIDTNTPTFLGPALIMAAVVIAMVIQKNR